jgi:predicted ATPase
LEDILKESDYNDFTVAWGGFTEHGVGEPVRIVLQGIETIVNACLSQKDADAWIAHLRTEIRPVELRPLGLYSTILAELVDNVNEVSKDNEKYCYEKYYTDEEDDASTHSKSTESLSLALTSGNRSLDMLRMAVRALLRCICAFHGQPIVLIFEHVEFADTTSQHILRTLGGDVRTQNLLLVTTHGPSAKKGIKDISTELTSSSHHRHQRELKYHHTLINLNPLSSQEMVEYVKGWSDDAIWTHELAGWLHTKTNGDPRLAMGLILKLVEVNIIQWQDGQCQCDMERVLASDTGELIDDEMSRTFHKLPYDVQIALVHAACMGQDSFSLSMLCSALYGPLLQSTELIQSQKELEQRLEVAVHAKLLCHYTVSPKKYQFQQPTFPDKIRDSLLPSNVNLQSLYQKMGENLLHLARETTVQDVVKHNQLLLQAVHLLNMGPTDDGTISQSLAELNHQAASIAFERAYIFTASAFCQAGLTYLPSQVRWRDYYDLALCLSILYGRVLYAQGNLDECEHTTRTVLTNARSFEDKKGSYEVLVKCLFQQQRGIDAIAVATEALAELGVYVPRSNISLKLVIARQAWRTQSILHHRGLESLSSLPMCMDTKVESRKIFLHLIGEVSNNTANDDMLAYSITRRGLEFLKHGSSTPLDLVCIAVQCAILDDHKAASRLVDIANEMMDNSIPVIHRISCTIISTFFIEHWRSPTTLCLERTLQCRDIILEYGYVDELFYCSIMYGFFYFHSGLPLPPLEKDMKKTDEMLVDFGLHTCSALLQPFLQFIQNLVGQSEKATVLTGHTMEQSESLRKSQETENRRSHQTVQMFRMMLCYFFGDLQQAVKLSHEMFVAIEEGPSPMLCPRLAFQGLLYFANAHATGKPRFARRGRSYLRRLQKMLRRKCPNVFHYVALLEAEDLAFVYRKSKNTEALRRRYDNSIAASGRLGILHIQALANERAGLFFLRKGEMTWASTYLTQAHVLYREWGAVAKSSALEEEHGDLIDNSQVGQGTSHRGRERLSLTKRLDRATSLSLDI